jgi:hypothetical protein
MKEQLISFETAKLAKEKGFDELSTVVLYNPPKIDRFNNIIKGIYATRRYNFYKQNPCRNGIERVHCVSQALLQRWLREIKFCYVNVQPIIYTGELKASYYQPLINQSTINIRKKFDTWEEALEEGLKAALNLI